MDDRDSHKRRIKYLKRIFITSFILTLVLVCGLERHIMLINEKNQNKVIKTMEEWE